MTKKKNNPFAHIDEDRFKAGLTSILIEHIDGSFSEELLETEIARSAVINLVQYWETQVVPDLIEFDPDYEDEYVPALKITPIKDFIDDKPKKSHQT
jgi:hypothetical protein